MSARHAILFSILIAILFPYYYFVDRPQLKTQTESAKSSQENLFSVKGVDSVVITRGDEKIRFEKTTDGKRFQLVEPQGKFVPQDLMQALASLLINAKQVEIVSTNPSDLAEFGLDKPKSELVLSGDGGGKPIDIFFGSENPTHTAIYARIEGVPKVFLLGKSLEYYQTLMFQWVEGKQGKNA